MQRLDEATVRAVIKQLYVQVPESPQVVTETFMLSPVYSPTNDTSVRQRECIDRMESKGWITKSRDIHVRFGDQPVTFRPTQRAFEWARHAFDDANWAAVSGKCIDALMQF